MSDAITRALATYAIEAPSDLAGEVVSEVERRTLDALGCAFLAQNDAGPRAARRYGYLHPHPDGPRLWGTSATTDAETAALVNGATARYLDLNDSYFALESLHPSDMLAALIAVGETEHASGREVVLAAAIGYEVAMDLCDSFSVRAHGWDHVNVLGLGACAGVGRLMGLTVDQMEHAFALQVVPHAAMRQTRHGNLAMWKGFAAADAARQAVYACSLARAGVAGPYEAFEGGQGFINQVLGGELPNPAGIDRLRALETPARILDSHIKVWPFGYVAQSAVEAASRLRDRLDDVDKIATVDITTFQAASDMMGSPEKWRPTTRETADHSVPYVVAEMLRFGDVTEASFEPDRFGTEETHTYLQEKVRMHVDEGFTQRYAKEFPTRVEVTTSDGEQFVQELDVSLGHARRPMPDDQLSAKYHRGADLILGPERAAELEVATYGLNELEDVRTFTTLTVA